MRRDETLHEMERHGSVAFPLQVYMDDLDQYETGKIPWHWHFEMVFGVLVQGSMVVRVPEKELTLHQGEGFFVNVNVPHEIQPLKEGTVFHSVVFSPSLLLGFQGSVIDQKYISPLIRSTDLRALAFCGEEEWHSNVISMLMKIFDLFDLQQEEYEFAILIELYTIMRLICHEKRSALTMDRENASIQDETRVKDMLDHIHLSYMSKLSLRNIAGAAHISESECCRCFKRVLKTTPITYLSCYRLSAASKLLREGFSATYASKEAGFSSQSYFTTQFKKMYECTPRQYMKRYAKS